MRAHAVGDRLNEGRPVAGAGPVQGDAGGRHDGEHVVAVHAQAGNAETRCPAGDVGVCLHPHGFGDGPLVVLAEEDHRHLKARGEDQCLVHVALARGAVAEVGDRHAVGAVEAGAERPAGGVQGLRADDDGRRGHAHGCRIPAGLRAAPPHLHEVRQAHAAAVGDPVFAVAGEHVVVVAQRPRRADLGGLLAEQRRPQAQLTLTLQGGGFGVDAAHQHHVFVEGREGDRVDVGQPGVEVGVRHPLTEGGEQLYEVRADRCHGAALASLLMVCGEGVVSVSPEHRQHNLRKKC